MNLCLWEIIIGQWSCGRGNYTLALLRLRERGNRPSALQERVRHLPGNMIGNDLQHPRSVLTDRERKNPNNCTKGKSADSQRYEERHGRMEASVSHECCRCHYNDQYHETRYHRRNVSLKKFPRRHPSVSHREVANANELEGNGEY